MNAFDEIKRIDNLPRYNSWWKQDWILDTDFTKETVYVEICHPNDEWKVAKVKYLPLSYKGRKVVAKYGFEDYYAILGKEYGYLVDWK